MTETVVLTKETKLKDLLDKYPFLLDTLVEFDNKLKLLKNPVMRKTIGRKATLLDVTRASGVNFSKLISTIHDSIEKNAGEKVELNGVFRAEDKKEILRQIVLDLHAGKDFEELRNRFNEELGDIESTDIAEMEQSLIDSGDLTSEQITKLCDIHVGLFDDSLSKQVALVPLPGHPLHTYKSENEVAATLLKKLRKNPSKELLDDLYKITIHYTRLQNQLFPMLEKKGFTAPTQVMWAKQDEIRDLFKKGMDALPEIMVEVEEMIYKEEKILFPTAMDLLSKEDWDAVAYGEEEIGYAWITPVKPLIFNTISEAVDGTETETTEPIPVFQNKNTIDSDSISDNQLLKLRTGELTLEQINLLLTHLPVESSFIDENDRVKFYSDHKHRIFPRSPGVIGRAVQNCHPQKSVATVNRILDAFRDGSKDEAIFWINFIGKKVLIRYYAVRDEQGRYRGALEVTEDITDIQTYEGEQRLLSWDQNMELD